MRYHALFLALLPVVWAVSVSADVVVVYDQGNTPVPVSGDISASSQSSMKLSAIQEKNISMDEETVRIEETDSGSYNVTCSFTMSSHSDKVLKRLIGFPIVEPEFDYSMARSFKVKVDGKKMQTKIQMLRDSKTWEEKLYGSHDHGDLNYPGYVVWSVVWKPKQTIKIICTYDAGIPVITYYGLSVMYRLKYIVRTGALWRGPIGKARISVKFTGNFKDFNLRNQYATNDSSKSLLHITYPENAEWISNDEIVWHFKDWNPDKDIVITKAKWQGFHKGYFFLPPFPYQGDRIKYTDAMLDSLIEKELNPWKRMFLQEVAKMDRIPLRRYIAECLFHEITARHGDAFILGKVGDGPKPKVFSEEDDSFYYGKWKAYFDYFSLHGGWYRPDMEKTISDKDLNDFERANRAFLKSVYSDEDE